MTATPSKCPCGDHAIVIGASMAGLTAARVLADRFRLVTVLEQDRLPEGCESRKGVPQGRHAHALLARGREGLEALFPGFTAELAVGGAVTGDVQADVIWFNYGVRLDSAASGHIGLLASRPLLETHVRRRLGALPNVRLVGDCRVASLDVDSTGAKVIGVNARIGNGSLTTLNADLVVDASGRGSRSPAWLTSLGYRPPSEEKLDVGICYTTRLYRRCPADAGGKRAVFVRDGAPHFRFGVALAQEDNRWILTVGGYLGDATPCDDQGALDFARSLPTGEIHAIMSSAEPLSDFCSYRFASNLRRRYELLDSFPEGYLVVGDALCSFNPVYGQGMTIAVLEAGALADCLDGGTDRLARRFFARAAAMIDIPWQMVVDVDLAHPDVEGTRTLSCRFFNWYIGLLHRAGRQDAVVTRRFLEVVNLIASPMVLLSPPIAWRVLRGNKARP
jgi:2-polyprenyl-6-methoxyphenol hydroxylase-like FAD-dependent oxidoreductase